jgi:hypothetical protein
MIDRCGSGLSGETITEQGHYWVGIDISSHMLGRYRTTAYYINFIFIVLGINTACIYHTDVAFGKEMGRETYNYIYSFVY